MLNEKYINAIRTWETSLKVMFHDLSILKLLKLKTMNICIIFYHLESLINVWKWKKSPQILCLLFTNKLFLFFFCFEDNLSYNKLATESLTNPGQSTGARNAVDKNTATCTRQYDIGSSSLRKTVWWKVDLGDVHNICSISIFFKTYDGYGMYFNQCNYVNKRLLELRILASSEKYDFLFLRYYTFFKNQLVLIKTM